MVIQNLVFPDEICKCILGQEQKSKEDHISIWNCTDTYMNGLNHNMLGHITIKEVILSVRAQKFPFKGVSKYVRKSRNILIKQVQYHFEKEQKQNWRYLLRTAQDDIGKLLLLRIQKS